MDMEMNIGREKNYFISSTEKNQVNKYIHIKNHEFLDS